MLKRKKDLNKCKGISCSWARRLKILTHPKLIYRFSAIPIKPSRFCRNWQANSKMYMKMYRIQSSQNNLAYKNKVIRFLLPHFKIYYKTLGIKILWYWLGQTIVKWNRMRSPEIDPYMHSQLIFLTKTQMQFSEGKKFLFIRWCLNNQIFYKKKKKRSLTSTSHLTQKLF